MITKILLYKCDTSCSEQWNNNGITSTNQLDADCRPPRHSSVLMCQFVFLLWIRASVSAILLRWRWSIVISSWQVFCQECCAVNDGQLLTHESFTHLPEQHPQYQPLGLSRRWFVTRRKRNKPAFLWLYSIVLFLPGHWFYIIKINDSRTVPK